MPVILLNIFMTSIFLFIGYKISWIYMALYFVMQIVLGFATYRAFEQFKSFYEQYIATLSKRLQRTRDQAFNEIPIGVLIYSSDFEIEWLNPYMAQILGEEALIGRNLRDINIDMLGIAKDENNDEYIEINERIYQIYSKLDERVLYLSDETEYKMLMQRNYEEQVVIGYIFLDNYDEMTQGILDQEKAQVSALVSSIVTTWAQEHNILLRRTSSEKFIMIMNNKILNEVKKTKFNVLDMVREKTSEQGILLTLSIGIGIGKCSLLELATLAQSSLDLTLGRGGDQVSIKSIEGEVQFFGGKTNPVEKRTRVRARVISDALQELINESDKVIIMGHRFPDMDSLGASIGIQKITQLNQTNGFIVLDQENIDQGAMKLVDEVKQNWPTLWEKFISPEMAMEICTPKTVLVVVDTHKPSMTIKKELLDCIQHVVVIDHHRRGEEFIQDATLVYMEPYASSTAELVTELLEYQKKTVNLNTIESTAMLAGIIVDTKSFTTRTGSRTFNAASYLRQQGADTILAQNLLKESRSEYLEKISIIQGCYMYKDGIAIAVADENRIYDQVLIAKTADTLLSLEGVKASFVLAKKDGHKVSMSARSLGDINVQIIMEQLHGGGHLTNAATQIDNISLKEAECLLKEKIDIYLDEGGEN